MRLAALVPAGFLAGAASCLWLLRWAPHSIATDLAQPLVVATYWQQFGAQIWATFALAVAIASIGYVAALRARCSLNATIALGALACAAALLFPVVFSSDVYAYAGYGDMALHGINPYAHVRIGVRDPLLDAMLWQWGNPPPMCVYGPAFVWIAQAAVALFLPLGAAAPLWALRLLSCVALVACAPLAYGAFSSFPRSTRRAAAAGIALNPLAVWSAAEGHNDALALAIVLAGFALLARSRTFTGALVIALSALVKAPGAVAAAMATLAAWPDRSRFARTAGGAALGVTIVAALAIPLEYGIRAHLAPQGRYFPQFSPQYVSVPLTIVVVAALAAGSFIASRGSSMFRYQGLTLAAWLLVPNPYPWYALWLLPVAFLQWNTRAAWALIAASLLIALRYYAEATTALSRPLSTVIVMLEFGVPLALFSAHMVIARRVRREIHTTAPDFAMRRST